MFVGASSVRTHVCVYIHTYIHTYICGGGGIRCSHACGPQYMYTCILARRPHKVIAWAIGLLYKV